MSDIDINTTADETPNEIPIPIDAVESQPSKPEFISETLYIQNLNEKIRIDGVSCSCTRNSTPADLHLSQSSKHLCAAFSSRMARYSM